jgi:hypothetical protein
MTPRSFSIPGRTAAFAALLAACFPACQDNEAQEASGEGTGSSSSETRGTESETATEGTDYGFVDDEGPATEVVDHELPEHFKVTLSFEYNEVAGRPAPADLALATESGQPVFQVFSDDGRPFAAAGLVIKPLSAGVVYEVSLDGDGVRLRNIETDEVVLGHDVDLRTAVRLSVATPARDVFAAPVEVIETEVR